MKSRALITHGIGFILLALGLESCAPDRGSQLMPAVEIKLKPPLVFNSKAGGRVLISSMLPDNVIDGSDWIQFTGFRLRSTQDPIQLITKTTCTHSNGKQSLKSTRPLPLTIQISALLPTEYFLSPQKPYPRDLKCSFNFKAVEPASQASHSFSLKAQVTISPQVSPAMEFSYNQSLLTKSETTVTLSPQQLENSILSSDRSDLFQLHCQHFAVELYFSEGKPRQGKELWWNPRPIPHPTEEKNSFQLCRILGYRQKFITSWSPYFYLQTP